MSEMRKIAVVMGSDSDLPQCVAGLEYLQERGNEGRINVRSVETRSVHRNMEALFTWLYGIRVHFDPDVILAGAGMAAHLPGMLDARLRYSLSDTKIVVIGVAFENDQDPGTLAAKLSISHVPGTQVVWHDNQGQFVGPDGFYRACVVAADGGLPQIALPKARAPQSRSMQEVLATFN